MTETGKFQIELTCMYKPDREAVTCPRLLKNVKEKMVTSALRFGEKPSQYPNTPTCDTIGSFQERYVNLFPGIKNYLL